MKKIAIWYWARCSLELSKRYQSSSLLLVALQPSSSKPGRASSASSTSFARAARTYNQTMDVGDGSDQVSLPQPAIRYVMTMDPCRTGSYYAIASFHSFPISPSFQWYLQRHTTSTPVCPGQLAMARPCPFDKTLGCWKFWSSSASIKKDVKRVVFLFLPFSTSLSFLFQNVLQLKFTKKKTGVLIFASLSVCCMFFFTSGKLKKILSMENPTMKILEVSPIQRLQPGWSTEANDNRFSDACGWPVDEWQPIFHEALKWLVCVFLNKVHCQQKWVKLLNDVKCKWHPLLLGSNDLGEQKGKWKSENMSLSTIDTRSWPRIQLFGGLSLEVDMANAKSLESCPLFSYESHRNSRRFKSCHMISLAQRIWHVVKTTISRWVLWKSRDIGGVAF